jgi:outer membrane usher protein FimD/PapC
MIITDIAYRGTAAGNNLKLNVDTRGGSTTLANFPVHGDRDAQPTISLTSGVPVPAGAAVKVDSTTAGHMTLCGYLY